MFISLSLFLAAHKVSVLLGCLSLVGLSALAFFAAGYYNDKLAWNKGVCSKCEKYFWESFDVDSSGAIGYTCPSSGHSHWQNGWFRKKKMSSKHSTHRPAFKTMNGDSFKRKTVPKESCFTRNEIELLLPSFKWKKSGMNGTDEPECVFFKQPGRSTYYTKSQILDLFEFGNIICEEDDILYKFILETSIDNTPLYLNDQTFGKFARWRLEIRR